MRITRIEQQKRDPRRVNLFADGEFAAGISRETLLRAGLRTGDEISRADLETLIRAEELANAKQAALRLFARRPRSVREIRDRLREREFPEPVVHRVLEDLERVGLLNDAAFARMVIRDAVAARPTGRILLRRKLLTLGVDKQTVDEALAEILGPTDDRTAAADAARKFLKKSRALSPSTATPLLKRRLIAFLSRRGYAWDIIEPVTRELLREEDE